MRLRTRWLILSVGGGIVVTALLSIFPQLLDISFPPAVDLVSVPLLWPVVVCEHLVGPGPSMGSPGRHLHEGTPIHLLAAVVGVALSWMFWTSVAILVISYRSRPMAQPAGEE